MRMIETIIFDMDGTLTQPMLDFGAIRTDMGLGDEPILEALDAMKDTQRLAAESILLKHERRAAEQSQLNPGVTETLSALRRKNYKLGLLTRNSRCSVETVLSRHRLQFDAIRDRDDGITKPDPESLRQLCSELHTEPTRTLMVGDYLYDIECGNALGSITVLLVHGPAPDYAQKAHHVIERIDALLNLSELK